MNQVQNIINYFTAHPGALALAVIVVVVLILL